MHGGSSFTQQSFSRPGAIGGTFLGTGEMTMHLLEPALGCAQVTRMSHRASLAISEKGLEAQINADEIFHLN